MYVLIKNDVVEAYPYSVNQLYADNPDTSFPSPTPQSTLANFGVFPVVPTPQPSSEHTQNVREDTPQFLNGNWVQVWEVTPATPEEIQERLDSQWESVRSNRRHRLSTSDWTQLPDCPLTNVEQTQWATYRQGLRDITDQPDPFNITWPTEPTNQGGV